MSETHLALYLTRLLDTLQQELKDNLLAVYLFGSAGYNSYEPNTSDVDVYAVIYHALNPDDYNQLALKISHASIPCPARKLEFVLFTNANAALQTGSPQFEMNLNTGRENEDDYINLDATSDPRFWFVLDIALGRELGTPLFGPPVSEVFAAPKREWILDAMVESLDWQFQQPSLTPDGILNACRALRFVKSGEWGSKTAGGHWVIGHYKELNTHVVSLALQARSGCLIGDIPPTQAVEFLNFAKAEIEQSRSAM